MCEISIIMPVCTNAYYFKKAISSIYNQSFTDFELICVDDCCKDQEVIKIFKEIECNENTKIIRNQNPEGAASSRNKGLEVAKGNYVIFLDSDDIFHPHLLDMMYKEIKADDSDVCVCSFSSFIESNKGEIILTENKRMPKNLFEICNDESYLLKFSNCPWNKLIKKSYLLKHKLKFQNLSSCNDLNFSMMSIMCTNRISIVNELLIMYRTNSINAISRKRNSMNLYYAIEKTLNDIELESMLTKTNIKQILYMLFYSLDYEIKSCIDKRHNISFIEASISLWKKYEVFFADDSINKKIKIIQHYGPNVYLLLIKYYLCIEKINRTFKTIFEKMCIW